MKLTNNFEWERIRAWEAQMASAIGGTNFQFVVLVGFLRLELRIRESELCNLF